MCRCSFNTDNALNGLLTKDRVSKSASNVRELLVITPFNFPLVALVVIIMTSSWPVLKSLLVVDLLGLGEPGASWLSPPVVEFKVYVVQMRVNFILTMSSLVILGRNVALLFQVLWTNLRNMHVNHVGIVSVDLHHLVRVLAIHINVVVWTDMLVRQDNLGLAVLVAWSVHVSNLHIAGLLLFIHLEEEVLLSDHLIIGTLCEFLSADLIFEFNEANLLLDNLVDSLADLLQVLGASCVAEGLVRTWHCRILFKGVQIGSLFFLFRSSYLQSLL